MTDKAGRSRIIKNLAPSLTERGKIKIGEKGKMITSGQGKEFQLPKKLEHFRVVSLHRGDDGNYISDIAVHDMYGDKPTELPVRLLFDDIELNFQCRYSCFKGKTQWCTGDGEYGWRLDDKGENQAFKCPCPRQDPTYKGSDKCKINSCLSVLIDGVETIGGVWKFRTTSYNSTVGLLSSLTLIKSVTGGPLAGIPLILYISPKTVISPADGKVQTIYIVGLEYKGSFERLQELGYTHALNRQKHMIRMEDIEENARKLLQAGDSVVDEDVVEEFYPEQALVEQMEEDVKESKEKPNYTAQDLKAKLDAGDTEIEGYSKIKDTPESSPLEQGEPVGTLPDGVDPIEWLTACRPSTSIANAKAALKVFEEQESEINMLSDRKLRDRLVVKHQKTKDYIYNMENHPLVSNKQQTPVITPERMEFEEKMRTYMGRDEQEKKTRYQDKLNDLGFLTMDDVKGADQGVVLGFLKEEFMEE